MGSNENTVQLKVFIDKKKNRVMFAEAGEDFVEILFSFLTLPLGTIARLSSKHMDSNGINVGSLTSLYQSVLNLDVGHFSSATDKDVLLNPVNSSAALCQKLKLNLNVTTNGDINGSHGDAMFFLGKDGDAMLVRNNGSFLITDDLSITPFLLDKTFEFLNTHGVEYTNSLDERSMDFGLDEFSNLLKWSLVTKNPLTNLVIGGISEPYSCSSCLTKSTVGSSAQHQMVKLAVQKSTKKVLCAQVEDFFVEMLFSFLTIPLGAVIRLTRANSSPLAIDNVYNSVLSLEVGKYLISEDVKNMLLDPKLASNYLCVTDYLPIYETNTTPGYFLEKQSTFIVSDELEVANPPCISTITKFTNDIPVADIEVREESIGEQEALFILKASLASTSALTDCFNHFQRPSA